MVVILRSSGEKVVESPLYNSLQGLAWTPSGNEVWTTSPLESGEMRALSLSGKVRPILAVPGRLRLEDIAADGRLLVEQGIYRWGIIAADGQSQRDLSWLNFGYLRALSEDGKTVLFEEEGNQLEDYAVFVRNVDNSPAIPLGEGYAVALSPDKHWALGQKLNAQGEMWLLPVGTGESRRISPPKLTPVNTAGFLPDGRHVIYAAREARHGLRSWLQDLNGGEPRAITDEGVYGALVSPDGKWLLAGGMPTLSCWCLSRAAPRRQFAV